MKKLLLLPLLIFVMHLNAQTLFTYGKHSVSTQEFLNAFEKNKKLSGNDTNALAEYLGLYINFKLKVQDAKDHGFDTLPALQADLQGFKNQIENNYTYDKGELQRLLGQALARSRKDVHITAMYIRAGDSSKAKQAAVTLSSALQKGKQADIASLAKDGIQITNEDFGYITVFTLPYEIENIVYALNPGQYSIPYKYDEGFYIFKHVSDRPAAGKIKLAQILIAPDPEDPNADARAHDLADSLYHVLQKGGDFAALAKEFSNDRSTYMNGGEMHEISVGKYSPVFEKHAFALKNDGDVAAPFKTSFGYHIIKRLSATPVPQSIDEDFKYQLKQQLLQDDRIESAKNKLLEAAIKKTGFTQKKADTADVFKISDTSLIKTRNIQSHGISAKSVLYTFNDGTKVTVQDWDNYIRISGRIIGGKLHESYALLWPDFKKESILKNYKSRLRSFDPEFASQISEFSDGNMLFEMMQRKVWMKAASDSAGLEEYYNAHQSQYIWKQSADAIIFSCNNEATARHCIDALQKHSWREVMKQYAQEAQADSGRFEFPQLPIKEENITEGIHDPVINRFDGTASFVKVVHIYPEHTQRSFNDARGLVIEDYQNLLEQRWIAQLKKKYPVKINQSLFLSIKKNYGSH